MRYLFKRTYDQGLMNSVLKVFQIPLKLLKDFTCPMSEQELWDRSRASVFPLTLPFAFFYLIGKI